MPEGDTIHRTADRLRPALAGRALVRLELPRTPRPHPPIGATIESVEAVGKHLLIRFAGGWTLQTHLRMSGSWHLYRAGERWQRPAHLARAVVGVEGWEAVCFAAPVVRVVHDGAVAHGSALDPVGHLGPDLCQADADLDDALARMATVPEPGTTIDEVLLDQRVAAGIGNVFKSEVLWACRVHPFVPIEAVDEPTRRRLLEVAARQLQANLGAGPRTTVPGPPGSLAVYGRARRPCRRCGTPIRTDRRGSLNRTTSWCPRCQPPPGG